MFRHTSGTQFLHKKWIVISQPQPFASNYLLCRENIHYHRQTHHENAVVWGLRPIWFMIGCYPALDTGWRGISTSEITNPDAATVSRNGNPFHSLNTDYLEMSAEQWRDSWSIESYWIYISYGLLDIEITQLFPLKKTYTPWISITIYAQNWVINL